MKTVPVILAAVSLAGCVSFGAKPPKSLLTLNPAATVTAGADRRAGPGETLTILFPSVPAPISNMRVPVYDGATAIAYVKDAQWVDTPSRMFQRLLSETVAASTGRVVLDLRQYTADPGTRVSGVLQKFGIDAGTNEAVVVYDALLQRPGGGGVETRRFEARAPVGAINATNAGAALNRAANSVAAEAAAWVAR